MWWLRHHVLPSLSSDGWEPRPLSLADIDIVDESESDTEATESYSDESMLASTLVMGQDVAMDID